jgi:hypothetical protein
VKDDARKDDGIDVVCFAGCDWKDIKDTLKGQGLLPEFVPAKIDPSPYRTARSQAPVAEDNGDALKRAAKIWASSKPLLDTLGWRYFLEHRGIDLALLGDMSHALRWHAGQDAIIALMTEPRTNEMCGVHRTFLNADGTKCERKMLGRQGVVRLSPDEDVTVGFGICEGVEDALCIHADGWSPVWAATSSGAVARFPVLPGIEHLTIFADNDTAGIHAAVRIVQVAT